MKAILTFFISICFAVIAKSQTDSPGELQGRVYDASTNEGIPFAPVVLEVNGALQALGQTDDNGNYTLKPLPPGSYDLRIQYLGYKTISQHEIQIVADRISFQNAPMQAENRSVCVEAIVNRPAHSPVRDVNCTPVRSNAIDQNATAVSTDTQGGASSLAAAGITQNDGASLNIRGSRENATVYYVDGVPVHASTPANSIEQISIITGGLPAKYENANEPGSESEFYKKFRSKNSPLTYSMRVPF